MRSLAGLVIFLCTGCQLWFTGGDDAPDVCALAEDGADPAIATAPLRDPGNLTCQGFGAPCNSECGPCPAATEPAVAAVKPTPPIPSWNFCGHVCETKSEGACAADPQCRVVKIAECTIGPLDCLTDFLGCFPIDTAPDTSVACHGADAWDCSRSAACTAIHSGSCPSENPDCDRPFELCVPEGTSPGSCRGTVTCDAIPPACPAQTTPGIEGGCYTGACIPSDLCGPSI